MVFLKPPEPPPPEPEVPENVGHQCEPPATGVPGGHATREHPDRNPAGEPHRAVRPKDFTGKGVEGGIAAGVAGGTGPVPTIEGEVFLAAEVDETPQVNAGHTCQGKYPPVMQSAGIPGRVVLQFVVNVDGHADPSNIKIISSTHKAFEEPAKAGLLSPGLHLQAGQVARPAGARPGAAGGVVQGRR